MEHARALASELSDGALADAASGDMSQLEPEAVQALREEVRRRSHLRTPPLLSTTPTLPHSVRRVMGIVSAEYVMSITPSQGLAVGMRSEQGRSTAMEAVVRDGRSALLAELQAQASRLRADAVVGVSIQFSEWSGAGKALVVLLASGTAVQFDAFATGGTDT